LLLEQAMSFGVKDKVREFISYGNLTAADSLIKTKKDEDDAAKMVKNFEMKISSLPETCQPLLKLALADVSLFPVNSREWNKAIHKLEALVKGSSQRS
jgi:hypothetical protein